MKTFQLQLKPQAEPLPHTARAWFLPGAVPRAWLDEAVATGLPPAQLLLHIVPRSARDQSPAGVLLISEIPFAAGKTGAAIPCKCLGAGTLYLPHGSTLQPPVSAAELEHSLPSDHYFLHPSLGLTAFDADAAFGVLDLLETPAATASDWSHAHPGRPSVPRLRSVELTLPESMEDILGSGQEDIGSIDKKHLPKHPGEKGSGNAGKGIIGLLGTGALGAAAAAGAAGALAAGGILRGLLKFTRGVPQTADRRTWVNFLQDWAERRLEGLKDSPQQEKEIRRLLHLLETDPDEGLKFAVPLGAEGARGEGEPASQLGRHDTEFSLHKLGGGQPYSAWDIGWAAQQQLAKRYREAANRELRLGRNRRAAYIYAELLKDKGAAADALEQGRHYHEAAVLYRDHLKRPLDAARCFRRAGMIHDAIAIYEEAEQFETLGDLLRELDREDEAAAAYRSEVARLLGEKHNPVLAARLLEHKLHAPEEALSTLQHGWSTGQPSMAANCLREEFALLKRLARPEAADRRIAEVTADTAFQKVIPLVSLLGDLARSHSNPGTRELAKDRARVLAGSNLKRMSASEQKIALAAIHRSEEHDLLLQRDTRRYSEQQLQPAPPRVTSRPEPGMPRPKPPVIGSVTRLDSADLPKSGRWMRACPWEQGYFLAGSADDRLVVKRISLPGDESQTADWHLPPAVIHSIEVVTDPLYDRSIHVFSGRRFLEPGTFGDSELTSTFELDASALGLAHDSSTNWTIEVSDGDLALYGRDRLSGKLVSTHSLSRLPLGADRERLVRELGFIPMVAASNQVIFAFGTHIGRVFRDRLEWLGLDDSVLSLHASPPHTKLRLVATHPSGATVLWGDSEWGQTETVAREIGTPVASFTRSGLLVLAGREIAKTFVLVGNRVIEQHQFSLPDRSAPIGIIDQDLRHFLIITSKRRHQFRFDKL